MNATPAPTAGALACVRTMVPFGAALNWLLAPIVIAPGAARSMRVPAAAGPALALKMIDGCTMRLQPA